ncbi:MAG: hypothetical protein LBI82_02395 [Dysgonamonadaceae bacterium]|jgi:putative cell wall-binding protein|nr:hypothetical protein [Dysgonamonadaceae bacterium]
MTTIVLKGNSGADIRLISKLAEKMNIDVLPLSLGEIEEIEDLKLLHIMRNARQEGLADRTQTLEKLGL